jgi:hypothetical protein
MTNTYENGDEADADKAQQEQLLASLDAAPRALRRDECCGVGVRPRGRGRGGAPPPTRRPSLLLPRSPI